jgi:hypothetical protein
MMKVGHSDRSGFGPKKLRSWMSAVGVDRTYLARSSIAVPDPQQTRELWTAAAQTNH